MERGRVRPGAEAGLLDLPAGAARDGTHVAFTSPDRATVQRFYDAALAAGGAETAHPVFASTTTQTYYSAFVLDPDGNNVEAVCHRPE